MGGCFSKKNTSTNNVAVPVSKQQQQKKILQTTTDNKTKSYNNKISDRNETRVTKQEVNEQPQQQHHQEEEEEEEEGINGVTKKEIFVIKHRKSHDRDKRSPPPPPTATTTTDAQPQSLPVDTNVVDIVNNNNSGINMGVRTSSCTKEEVDAILIQCGRLSRSNSSGTGKTLSSGRKYSGSKRSYDFDQDVEDNEEKGEDNDATAERRQHRQRHRQSGSRPSPSPQGRRRTPSRERDQQQQQQRSGSRERSGSSGRRVSRSPGRRSEISNSADNTSANSNRPGKMVSVPATVSNNGVETTGIKRISVKRNVGEGNVAVVSRTAASPRSRSPARMNGRVGNENNNNNIQPQQQQPSLSRNSSRKAEHSPYRRNPLSEIDNNGNINSNINNNLRVQSNNKDFDFEGQVVVKDSVNMQNQASSKKLNNCGSNSLENKVANNQQTKEAKGKPTISSNVVAPSSAAESLLKPEGLTRSRSARRSRDLDFDPETLGSSYTALLLEDIQNFHQKNTPSPAVSIPPCVAKACSILEAVADLNSTTKSNMSCALSDDRRSPPTAASVVNLVGKKNSEVKDPFVESEVLRSDDLMEPSFHKYVTVRRGGALCLEDMDGQESSGSNSFIGGSQQQWGFSNSTSSWEPNSADSTDRWTSRSNEREDVIDKSTLGIQGRHTTTLEPGRDIEEARKGFSRQRNGIGPGRTGGGSSGSKSLHRMTTSIAANVSTS